MEFTPLQIAKLVLGYLKKENCQAAVLAFCDASPHLKHFSEMIKNKKKYFITRVSGLSLVDYLTEYAVIYTLIQERLEDTDYFEENRSKNLVDQLRYLLDKNGRQNRENTPPRSRSSTPMKEQNKEHERLLFPKNLSIIEEMPSCNATPLQALPGNSNKDTPDKCPPSSRSRKSNGNGASDSEDSPDKSLEEDDLSIQVLTQTLLEHHELHEKIAENINLVRSTTEVAAAVASSTEERISSGVLQELDSAIKAIVQKTEADPIFEKLIGEIIGNVGETTDEEQTDGVLNNENTEIANSVHNQESDSTPVLESEENLVKQRLRSSKKQSPAGLEDPAIIQSNGSVAVNENLATSDLTKVNVQQNLSVNTTTGEIILYDGTLDNFMKTSTTGVSHTSNPLVYNNGLLMVQPSVPTLMPAVNTLQVNPSKSCYMWNGSQLVNVSVPQLKVNNLTEQDILTMPTVIVCDDNQQGIANNVVVPTSTNQQSAGTTQKKFVNIAPRLDKTADKAENISEFLTLYQCNDSGDSFPPPKIQPRVKTKKKSKKPCKSTTIPVLIKVLNPTEEIPLNEIKVETECERKPAASEADSNANASKTPELFKKISETHHTPKSGSLSHVRALDFNFGTPGKVGKETTSPKSAKKSPKKSPKVSTAKISKSLFGTPTKNQKASSNVSEDDHDKNSDEVDNKITREDGAQNLNCTEDMSKAEIEKASNSWDSQLRALAGPVSDRCPTPKRKRKDSLRNRKPVKRTKLEDGMERAQPNSLTESCDGAKTSKNKSKRKQKIAATPNKIIKRKLPSTTEKSDKIIKMEETEVKWIKSVEVTEAPLDANCVKESEASDAPAVSDMPFSLINCNAKARYKKKCNIDNNVKKEVKITKVKEIKSLEFVNDGSNKLILSPSKLNANKRTLVEVDEKETKVQCASEGEIKKSMDDLVVIEQTVLKMEGQEVPNNPNPKFLTPEMQNDPLLQQPVLTKRNLTPMLETPMKMIVSQCPKTPGLLSPVNNTDTPFTKVFKEQLQGVDISCIQTPKFPLTPNFPFTPSTDGVSPYPVRPSDYSTSSSYYQPSDAEQNKSLEQLMIDECKRLENKKDTPVKIYVKEECPALLEVGEKEIQSVSKEETEQDLTNKAIVEKMKTLSSNIIARKNLNLMDRINLKGDDDDDSSCNSSSSDDASVTSSSDIESDDNMWNFSNNATVVQRSKSDSSKSSRYNLRSRRGDRSKESPDVTPEAKKSTDTIQQIISEVEIKPTLEPVKVSTLSNHQEKVLQEMEEKRQRMIAKLKDDQNVTLNAKASTSTSERKRKKLKGDESASKVIIKKPVLPPRENNGRFIKVPGSASKDKSKKSAASRRKSNLPQKILLNERDTGVVETKNHPCEELEGVNLHLSSDSEGSKLEPFDLVETELRESSTSSTPLPISNISETHPLKNFHKVLESFTTNQNEKNKESNPEQVLGGPIITNQGEKNKERNSDQVLGSFTTNQGKKNKDGGVLGGSIITDQNEKTKERNSDQVLESFTTNQGRKNKEGGVLGASTVTNQNEKNKERNSEQVLGSFTSNQTKKNKESYSERALGSTTTNQNKESNSDQEAECLVKGLKEWGIHLIHNKSPKKQGKAQGGAALMDKVNSNGIALQATSENERNIKSDAPKTDNSEAVNSKDRLCSQTNDKKDELIKNDNPGQGTVQETPKINQSLEEGEILSEEESGKSTEIKKSKTKYIEKRTAPRRVEKRPTKQYKSSTSPKKRYPSNSGKSKIDRTSSSKSTVEKKTGTASKPKTKRRTSTSTAKSKTKELPKVLSIDSTEKVPPEIASVNKILDDLNLTNSMIELAFDIKTFPEEDLRLVHDESNTCTKQISQYDSELLNKKIAAKVYIESIDAEIEKFMTVTPFTFILDIPEGLDGKSTEPRVKILDCVTIHAKNTVSKKNMKSDLSSVSPLDNLYEPQMSGRYEMKPVKYKKTPRTPSTRRKSDDQQTQSTAGAPRQSRSKSLDQKMLLLTDKGKVKSADKEKKIKDASQTKQKKSAVKNSSCNLAAKVSTSTKNSTEVIDEKVTVDELEGPPVKETRTIVEISESVVDGNMTTAESINDELMTYAICGSQRSENTEEPSANNQKINSNKLPNCQELLSKLDVDVFLDKLHGE